MREPPNARPRRITWRIVGVATLVALASVPLQAPVAQAAPPSTAAEPGSVIGTTWSDLNRDGVRDLGEPAVPGVELTLLSSDGAAIDETTSRADGTYVFSPVDPGEFAVSLTLPEATDIGPTPEPRTETDVVNVFSHDGSDDEQAVRTGPLSVEAGGLTEANAGLAAVVEEPPTTSTTAPATTVEATVPETSTSTTASTSTSEASPRADPDG